jgi:hypothetical protein
MDRRRKASVKGNKTKIEMNVYVEWQMMSKEREGSEIASRHQSAHCKEIVNPRKKKKSKEGR